jgi:hypothetical protein
MLEAGHIAVEEELHIVVGAAHHILEELGIHTAEEEELHIAVAEGHHIGREAVRRKLVVAVDTDLAEELRIAVVVGDIDLEGELRIVVAVVGMHLVVEDIVLEEVHHTAVAEEDTVGRAVVENLRSC